MQKLRSSTHFWLPACLIAASVVLTGYASSEPPRQSEALTALLSGHVDEATQLAQKTIATLPSDGLAHEVLCRADYSLNMTDAAIGECQLAVAALPSDSEAQLWLGRAFGQKAEHANALSAFGLAKKVRTAFERAVQLDAGSAAAAGDLGEFYIAAPGMVGGGRDKAERLATTIAVHLPAASHRLTAMLAEKAGDLPKAETEYRAVLALGKTGEAYIDLANFYRRHNRIDETVTAVNEAIAADVSHGPVLVDAASILNDAGREPAKAEHALREYLESSHQTDAAPAFKVHVMLGHLLDKRGDHAAAKAEYTAALALAAHYAPARKALSGS